LEGLLIVALRRPAELAANDFDEGKEGETSAVFAAALFAAAAVTVDAEGEEGGTRAASGIPRVPFTTTFLGSLNKSRLVASATAKAVIVKMVVVLIVYEYNLIKAP